MEKEVGVEEGRDALGLLNVVMGVCMSVTRAFLELCGSSPSTTLLLGFPCTIYIVRGLKGRG